ncbi:hypothetical protein [Gluconobacter sphaericus]|uniref:DUF4440 domain-containing protein n=1 Tax=Gluconobacter sphaericus NBRC 12467 TaxID=1307951 RepID=A0AA37SG71_9PROT|nr:hypothetical protein [Gluconobacter sphaericus]MBF0884766.1 hypothetical protein [Gluconobacter sphaericus]MBS1085743.1 hypothetical protein [Gluconobacter sphaericus]MBS1100054.1 hypothetical protein [Gluconobacter sphaericus]QQX90328.1 hypothetical protein IGS75_08955 [Gluconobacter sphaericus]GBR54006.1 hypothetical protein AA12467_1594 [Gluconobacter sphaericus NBRC 12467]
MQNTESAASAEIIELHRLLQDWFCGVGSSDPKDILDRMTPDYMMVGAAGRLVTFEMFTKVLPSLRGSRPGLVMEIEDVKVLHAFEGGMLAFYREIQTQGETRTERWSSVLFCAAGQGEQLLWKHLQETFCS